MGSSGSGWSAIAVSALGAAAIGGIVLFGCGKSEDIGAGGSGSLSGKILIDGSSTVFPVSQAVAEEFMKEHGGKVNVTVAESGTGGGFKKFANGEIDISGASRPIKPEEIEACKAGGIEFIELPIAFDGLSVVVNPQNDFCDSLTVDELKKIWEPNSKVKLWSDVREGFPAEPIKLFGPGTDSGTFDYFTEEIVGESKASRSDFTQSEDDNILVQGVAGEKYALGYFGYAYFVENQDKLKLLGVDAGKGAVKPDPTTIETGTYDPLSRPIYIYVSLKALERPEVASFIEYFLGESGQALVGEVGYVKLPPVAYTNNLERVKTKTTGVGDLMKTLGK